MSEGKGQSLQWVMGTCFTGVFDGPLLASPSSLACTCQGEGKSHERLRIKREAAFPPSIHWWGQGDKQKTRTSRTQKYTWQQNCRLLVLLEESTILYRECARKAATPEVLERLGVESACNPGLSFCTR